MRLPISITMLAFAIAAHAQVRSGKASAAWVAESSGYRAGETLRTAVVLEADSGWHTYWVNPGESGIPTQMEFELPDGWKVVETGNPPPVRFEASGLVSFGYAGRVMFPVTLQAPDGQQGAVSLKAAVAWLACNDSGCIPGDAELTLKLVPDGGERTSHGKLIENAYELLPGSSHGLALEVRGEGHSLEMTLVGEATSQMNLAMCDVFPVSEGAIDPGELVSFRKSGDRWTATAKKSEYLEGDLKELELLLVNRKTQRSWLVGWARESSE